MTVDSGRKGYEKKAVHMLLELVMLIGMMPVHILAEDNGSPAELYGAFTGGEQVLGDMMNCLKKWMRRRKQDCVFQRCGCFD